MQVIDQINGSALFAQSAYSASVATKDSFGRDITSTYITGIDLSNYYTKDETSGKEELANAFANIPVGDPEVNAYVHDNSATINDVVSTYQGASGTYYTTAEADTLSSMLSGAIDDKLNTDVFTAWSANQAANNYQLSAGDGISIIDDDINKITRIDVTAGGGTGGDMFTAYLEYNNQNQISGYAGSAFAGQGGGGNPEVESYVQTNSANIDDTVTSYQTNSGTFLTAHQAISAEEWNSNYETVNTNSGVWGGSALPISAGPGIKVNLVDNTLVFSNDETLLANNLVYSATTLTLSEPAGNFERLRLYDYYGAITEIQGNNSRLTWVFDRTDHNNIRMNRCYTITSNNGINWNEVNVYGWNQNDYNGITANGGTDWYLETVKVVGINRIAGGN